MRVDLPAPFSPMQRVHLTGTQGEINVVESQHTGKGDGDSAHLDEGAGTQCSELACMK